jgi:putative ABC transport system permease protein
MDVLETVRTALEALWANKLRSSLTMLGIVIGVGAVIALMSIGSGAQAAIAANIKSLGSNLITITPGASNQGGVSQGNGSAVTLTLDDATAIADPNNVPDAAAVSPELNLPGNARIVQHGQNISTKVVGVTPAYADVHAFPAVLGAWFTEDDVTSRTKVVMLGANVAQQLFGAADPTGQDISMRVDRPISVHVAGVLQSKGGGPLANVDDRVLMPISTLQRQLSNPRNPRGIANVSQIVVQAASTKSIPAAKDEMTQLLLQQHRVSDPDFVIQSQDDQVSAQAGTTQVLTILLGAIAGISLVVGGIGIMNIMIVSVTERTREIGIRKAVGAKRMDILTQFLVESLVVSVLGGLIGIIIGVGASRLIDGQQLNGQPIRTLVSSASIILAVSVSITVGLVFGVYPAYRAGSLRPIDALRYE